MEPNSHSSILIILLSFLLLFYSADAICRPRAFTYPNPSSLPNSIPPPPTTKQLSSSPPPRSISHPPSPSPSPSPPLFSSPSQQPSISSLFSEKIFKILPTNPTIPTIPHLPPLPPILSSFSDKFSFAIKNICKNTDYPEICLSSISHFFTGKTDPFSVLTMAIEACKNSTQIAIDVATKMVKSSSIAPDIASCIEDCKDNFSDAMDNLQSAIDAIPNQDIGTMQSMLSAVITDAETCNDGFAEGPGLNNNPFTSHGDLIHKLASNCLAIAELCK